MRRTAIALALFVTAAAAPLAAQGGPPAQGQQPGPGPAVGPSQDPFGRFFFPPELVMQHQSDIGLQDSQRATLQSAMQEAQSRFTELQWRLSAEGEKLGRLLQGATADESQVLEQVDRVLSLERDIKRAQVMLLVRIKNTLTPAQQRRLAELRDGRHEE